MVEKKEMTQDFLRKLDIRKRKAVCPECRDDMEFVDGMMGYNEDWGEWYCEDCEKSFLVDFDRKEITIRKGV